MEHDRAQEIIDAIELIQVTYHGIPVYIQSLDSSELATVFPLDNMNHPQSIDIEGLSE